MLQHIGDEGKRYSLEIQEDPSCSRWRQESMVTCRPSTLLMRIGEHILRGLSYIVLPMT